jgi:hypothetical protein
MVLPQDLDGLAPGHAGKGVPGAQQSGFSTAHVQPHGPQGAARQQQQQQQHYRQPQPQLAAVIEGEGVSSGDAWQQLQWQVTLGNSEDWVDAGAVRHLFRKVSLRAPPWVEIACKAGALG